MHYSFKSTPTWTMRGKQSSNSKQMTPGPGQYDSQKVLHKTATFSTVLEKRGLYSDRITTPGPGSYQSKSFVGQGPKRSMSAKVFNNSKQSPGPADYQTDTLYLKNKSPNFTIPSRSKSAKQIDFEKNNFSPAPTTYNKSSTFQPKNSAIFGSSRRKDLCQTERTPGPSHYQSEKAHNYSGKRNPQFSMGDELRKEKILAETPGPAMYNKKGQFDMNKEQKRGYSCRQRTPDRAALEISKFPGPGQYESTKNNASKFANTQTPRNTFTDNMMSAKMNDPSPDKYSPGFVASKHRCASAFDFGRSVRKPLNDHQTTPGPNAYENRKDGTLRSPPKFSVGRDGKTSQISANPETPGPAHYDASITLVKQASKQWQMGKSTRPDFGKHKYTPGPGYYDHKMGRNGGWIFPKEVRLAFTDLKSEAKFGRHYEIQSKVVDPPSYMNVQSKIQVDPPFKSTMSTLHSAKKSPHK